MHWNSNHTVAKGFIRELAIRPFLSVVVVSHIATQAALKIQKRYSKNKNSHDYKRFRNTLKKANEYCYYASTIAFFSLITMYNSFSLNFKSSLIEIKIFKKLFNKKIAR